jgi:Arc/MetJ-type ribon-helix-helix transcriptional regulator
MSRHLSARQRRRRTRRPRRASHMREDAPADHEFVVFVGDEARLALHQVPTDMAHRIDADPLRPQTDTPVKLLFGVRDPIACRRRLEQLGARFNAASHSGTIRLVSTQIAVRLPDELVAYVDEAVAAGRVKSRAELVARLIKRDARRQRAEEDLQRLAERGAIDDPELLDIVKSVSDTPLPID